MNVTKVAEDIYQLSVNVDNILFEGLWEIPNGVSLNSYIIKGEKTAIVDGVCGWDGVPESLFALLDKLNIAPETIEYLIINHMEPDHSGWIEDFKKINSSFKIICSEKASELLGAFYGHTEDITCVTDNDVLDLGNNHILKFFEIPNVHWPDTMITFDTLTGTLFSCDAFGSFGSVTDSNYDDALGDDEIDFYEKEAVRYYSNIVAAFSMPVKKAIDKCSALPVKIIAPGHGIVWRKNPNKIVEDYSRYASYQKGPAKDEITIIWGSMYGMTEKAVNHAIKVLEQEKIKFHVHRVPDTSWGTILASAWTSTGIILAMPTYEYKMFPPLAAALEELGKKKVFNRKAFRFGSYGWSGGAQKELDYIMDKYCMKWDFLEPVEFKGNPRDNDLELIEIRIKALVNEVRTLVNS
ncbi:FprA family A-type flavoprotein [Proteiniborus sp. MB09-C3]|uniref:FprA family A-type flavoprotein n=1 Tax=Proteiniborus sp. MB09-C3 TaxID=3050072 RepID=UPI0025564EEF|nr:FprA family A-type flavoprotein [Proteiniborus sp. MB09-C3]WIV13542.1 FprA family A-type flavoprotein [Proteiniborus sp. MB09-C3]